MGNCIRPSTRKNQEENYDHEMEEKYGKESGNNDCEKGGLRVKIMLTKEELEWLMFQLKENEGNKKLEDVLQEIERERLRGKVRAWRPSLESIKESSEGLELERL